MIERFKNTDKQPAGGRAQHHVSEQDWTSEKEEDAEPAKYYVIQSKLAAAQLAAQEAQYTHTTSHASAFSRMPDSVNYFSILCNK